MDENFNVNDEFNETASVSAKRELEYLIARYPDREVNVKYFEVEKTKYRVVKFWWGTVEAGDYHSSVNFMILD